MDTTCVPLGIRVGGQATTIVVLSGCITIRSYACDTASTIVMALLGEANATH
ncbi:MAG: hypothetical protein H0U72_04325 [Nitrosospira sp.]|nr:hypothetical protein [Nitrosospira sp.]